MAIEGPLRELGIHDVFQLLDLSRKTGRLRVRSALRDNEGTVFFREGRVVSAFIRSNPHPLGALLVRAGRVNEADLARARNVQLIPGETRRLGEIMVSLGMISRRDLERHVRQQIEVVVFELLSWQEGHFSFAEEDLSGDGIDGVTSVTTESLLMEGARRIDEWARVQERIPHLGMVPSLADLDEQYAARLELLPGEWEVLAAIDGESDFRLIASTLGRSEFDVARIGFGLLATGIVTIGPPREVPARQSRDAEAAAFVSGARQALASARIDEALSLAAAAVAAAPASAEARLLLSRGLARAGRTAEAEEELALALRHAPDDPQVLMDAARAAMKRGDLARGVTHWERVVATAPGSPAAVRAQQAIAHAARLAAVVEHADA